MATPGSASSSRRRQRHWLWFAGLFSTLLILQVVVAFISILPLAMATDPCHNGTPDRVCRLSTAGQNFLVMIPWLAVVVGAVVTLVAAAVTGRRGRSPLLALPIGIVAYLAAMPLSWQFAFTL